jgi:hypothetical protein
VVSANVGPGGHRRRARRPDAPEGGGRAPLASEREHIQRAAAADRLSKRVAVIEAALPGYLERSRVLADALSEIGQWHFESGQMANLVQRYMGQIEIAANFALAELKAMPDAIRQDRQAIPQEFAPTPIPIPEPLAGEDHSSVSDIFGNTYTQVIELMAGRAAERMLIDGEPLSPADDLRRLVNLSPRRGSAVPLRPFSL